MPAPFVCFQQALNVVSDASRSGDRRAASAGAGPKRALEERAPT
jgi:hypothetical protein